MRIYMPCLCNWTYKMQENTDTAIGSYFALMKHIVCVHYGPETLTLDLKPMRTKKRVNHIMVRPVLDQNVYGWGDFNSLGTVDCQVYCPRHVPAEML